MLLQRKMQSDHIDGSWFFSGQIAFIRVERGGHDMFGVLRSRTLLLCCGDCILYAGWDLFKSIAKNVLIFSGISALLYALQLP